MPDQYFGIYTGIVKDNRDDANLGQLKLSVPAIYPPDELMVARPALPYGHFFVPDNETKVWVQFEGGDPGLALWTGVQYVAGEWPDQAKADPPQLRVITTPAGHTLLFDDRAGQEKVELTVGEHGHMLTLDGAGITVTDGVNGHSITLAAAGVTAEHAGGAKVELTAAGATVDAGAGIVEVKGSLVKLGAGAVPVIRVGDSGIGNLGAPVVMAVTTNTQVLA